MIGDDDVDAGILQRTHRLVRARPTIAGDDDAHARS